MKRTPPGNPVSSRARRPRLHAGAALLMLSLLPLAAFSVTSVSDGLSAGSSPSSNTVHPFSAAAGINNTVGGQHALAVGDGNTVAGEQGNFASGKNNYVNGLASGAIGSTNTIQSNGTGGKHSFVFGVGNIIDASAYNTSAGGHYNIVYATHGHALGTVLNVHSFGETVVGWYNKAVNNEDTEAAARTAWRTEDPIFVVGNGTSGAARSNAMVVTKGGMTHIQVPARGGLGMGAYTTP